MDRISGSYDCRQSLNVRYNPFRELTPCYALKMDIRRFFDTVDHNILKNLLRNTIRDENVLKTTDMIIDSFKLMGDMGIPLGNVTSQPTKKQKIKILMQVPSDQGPMA